MLVLSLFPGIDLLGRGFELEGFCIVRGPDKLWGGDVRAFHAPANRFDGIIGGSPCQDFSRKRRAPPTGEGVELLREFGRVVLEAQSQWFLLENVPTVPDLRIEGYTVQRFDLNARECGSRQSRLRHFQFGSLDGLVIVPRRQKFSRRESQEICLASEGERTDRRTFADFCELQGLPRDFDLPGWSIAAKYRAVGNGVPVEMARVVASAIRDATCAPRGRRITDVRLCACNCGRILEGRQKAATPACRKRLERARKCVSPDVDEYRAVTISTVTALRNQSAARSQSL